MIDVGNEILEFRNYLRGFVGKSEADLIESVKLQTKAKSKLFMLASKICSTFKGKDYYKALFEHENIVLKTIQLKANDKCIEAMSFAPFKYLDICKETWNESTLRSYFNETTFVFFIFKPDENNINTLSKIGLWRMPIMDLDGELKYVWEKVVRLINEGNVVKAIDNKNRIITNFPKEAETQCFHVRPHGSVGSDVNKFPVPDNLTGYLALVKQSFWFNHNYVNKICANCTDI